MSEKKTMQLGMIGLGRMGANMVRRLMKSGHECVVFDRSSDAVEDLVKANAIGATSLAALVKKLRKPRVVWFMVPAGVEDGSISELLPSLEAGDILIGGGNSYYVDDIRRAKELVTKGIHYVDMGTSGGVWGLERGYCMMIGGEPSVVERLGPILDTLAPGIGNIPPTPGREKLDGTAEQGYLYCGLNGAGHFVKMVHNGIEYGIMAAYAEGFGVLRAANVGKRPREADAETTPLRRPENYQFDFNLADISEVWRRGSVIASWLLDLTANALAADQHLTDFPGRVSDSGEGRWTIKAAIDEGVPVPVPTTALYERFASRGEADYQNKLLSAMRFGFGGQGRGSFYEQVGTVRDVVQDGLFQVLANLAMEPPTRTDSESIRDEKVKVLKAIPPVEPWNIVRGQFQGGRQEPGVAPDSTVETFAALRLEIESWRWQGAPFYIRAGKCLSTSCTEILIRLRQPPTIHTGSQTGEPTRGRADGILT